MNQNELKMQLIKEQDVWGVLLQDYYHSKRYNHLDIDYSEIIQDVISDKNMIKNIKINNLITILDELKSDKNTEEIKFLRNEIKARIHTEKFAIDNVTKSAFLLIINSNSYIDKKLGQDIFNEIKHQVVSKLPKIKTSKNEKVWLV